MGARIVAVGEAVNDAERQVIAHLRDHGRDDWTVLHSVELRQRDGLFEVDLVVVTGHAVYVIDVKGTRGAIEVDGGRWFPAGRAPFRSPLPKLRANSKSLKGMLESADLRFARLYTDALVVLTAPDAALYDKTPDQRDAQATVVLSDLVEVLTDQGRVPVSGRRFDTDIAAFHDTIVNSVKGSAKSPSGPLRFGNWEVVERLSESQHAEGVDVLNEYRARNTLTGPGSGTVRLSVRAADPYAPADQRIRQQQQIGIAYEALTRLPPHPHVIGVRDFFAVDDESAFVTVFDDLPGHALRRHLSGTADLLTSDAKLRTIRQILLGLAHVHYNRVVHRELNPSTVLITQDGRTVLTGFDYAKSAHHRGPTVQRQAHEIADAAYLAPECHADPSKMSAAADVYAVGVIGFELLTGHLPFGSVTEQVRSMGRLPDSDLDQAGVGVELKHWLQSLTTSDPNRRPAAAEALRKFDLALGARLAPKRRVGSSAASAQQAAEDTSVPKGPSYFKNLPEGFQLGSKYTVSRRLGRPGSFGVAYRVYDTMRDVDRAVKLVLQDRESTMERLRREAGVLDKLRPAPHPNVVTMVDADRLLPPDEYPYLVFEYVEGKDLSEVIRAGRLGAADVLRLGVDTARGLRHIHSLGVWHCDIKPSNLLWTDGGVKLIDFGIAKTSDSSAGHTHTSPRYTPPDLDQVPADGTGFADRDLYGLGITMYEALTGGEYPWDGFNQPPPAQPASDPRMSLSGLGELSTELIEVIVKAISPYRTERYGSAEALLEALESIGSKRLALVEAKSVSEAERRPEDDEASHPPSNDFVAFLQTLYSQSHHSNRGTRGLDPNETRVYVPTALDLELVPALSDGLHSLVVITGNAGDGKTAFIEDFELRVRDRGAVFGPTRPNGSDFTFKGRRFHTNYDGSQDEGESAGDEVLEAFFKPFEGQDEDAWVVADTTRVIAINEGRLIDFLDHHRLRFPRLASLIDSGLAGENSAAAVAVVNLNSRDVTTPALGENGVPGDGTSILEQMITKMTQAHFWEDCASCDLAKVCYARHNALTFQHPGAGPQVQRRLRRVYELTKLRGQLHITLRDLRSALAYTLTSGRDCAEIHDLYAAGTAQEIRDSFYFSAYMGAPPGSDGRSPERDRLLRLLREADVAAVPRPQLDRRLDYAGLLDERALTTVDGRGEQDRRLLELQFGDLVRSASADRHRADEHRRFVEAARRLLFFELRDDDRAWKMLPYPSALRFLDLLDSPAAAASGLEEVLNALNRGEGLANPGRVGESLVLQVRDVPHGTIRSFRRFPAAGFRLEPGAAPDSPYIEGSRSSLWLRYIDPEGRQGGRADLEIKLDLFELLQRFTHGYRPSLSDAQGQQLALAVFKHRLSAVPYQEVLLTAHGHDLRRIVRTSDGALRMEELVETRMADEREDERWR